MSGFQGVLPHKQGLGSSDFSRHLLVQVSAPYSTLEVLLELKPTQISKRGERTNAQLTQPEAAADHRTAPALPPTGTSGWLPQGTAALPQQICAGRCCPPRGGCHQTTQGPAGNIDFGAFHMAQDCSALAFRFLFYFGASTPGTFLEILNTLKCKVQESLRKAKKCMKM